MKEQHQNISYAQMKYKMKKDCKSRKNLCMKNFTFTKNFYVNEIAIVNLSKIYFLKNAEKTSKPNNRDLNCN